MVLTDLITNILLCVGSFLGGYLLSLSIAYVVLGKDIAYIKGQLTNLLKFHDKLSKLHEKVVVLEKDVSKAQGDLNYAHGRIRDIQQKKAS